LKVKEDAMNDRAKHLQELQQVLAEQLRRDEEPKVEVLKDAEEAFERSIISDSRFVAIDAALTALLSCEAPKLVESPGLTAKAMNGGVTGQGQEVEGQVCRLSEGGCPAWRLTEQLDKERVAAFRKALDTADGLPSELRQDLCALLEESTPAESPSDSGHKVRRPPMDPLGKGYACGIQSLQPETPPFPHRALRPSRVRSSTPYKLTPRSAGQERRAVSAMSADQRCEAPVRRRSEALASAGRVLAG